MARILKHFVMAMFFTSTFAWRLKTSHQNVIPYVTDDVNLRCDNVMDVTTDEEGTIYQITEIRLLKSRSNSRGNSRWKSVAEINVPDISRVTLVGGIDLSDVIASGRIGVPSQSFLSVTWPTASLKTVGSYRCEVDGFVEEKVDYLHIETREKTITNSDPSTTDLVATIMQMKAKQTEKIEKLMTAHEPLQRDIEVNKNQILGIMNEVRHMSEKVDNLTRAHETLQWDREVNNENETLGTGIVNEVKHISEKLQNLTSAHETLKRDMEVKNEKQTYYDIMNEVRHMSEKEDNLTRAHETLKRDMEVNNENETLGTGIVNEVKHISEKLQNLTSAHETLKREMDVKNEKQTYDIMNEVQRLTQLKSFDARVWPKGNYSLLATSDGCPDVTPGNQFRHGYITFTAKTTTKPKHAKSATSHLSQPFYERRNSNNFLSFRYCTHIPSAYQESLHVPWPKGSYCIRRDHNGSCPDNFEYGFINFYLESISNLVVKTNNHPRYRFSRWIEFFFCCQKNGNPHNAVVLPTSKPFYLYRYGGVCQRVLNMDVHNEWIFLDTDDQKRDFYAYNTAHPDSSLNDVRLELCYYEKRDP